VAVTQFFVVEVNVAAAKENHSMKDVTKKAMKEELKTWFSNARDKGSGGRNMNLLALHCVKAHRQSQWRSPNFNSM